MKMKKLKKGQRGFSLVELVIVVALAGLVGVAITATAFQVFTFTTRISNQMTAIRQVQQAGFWVSPDVMMAQNVKEGGCANCLLTLNWTDGASNKHGVIYRLVDMSGGLRRLQREHYIGTPLALNSTTTVAEYIDVTIDPVTGKPKTRCEPPGVLPPGVALNFTVTATVGGRSETRTYEVKPRQGT
ncbi:MAG: type II secretion system GspH family protein [Dehalococcoidia bacterium]|nr:type II secretion system GspH family protein [Dehalococcoidia bacterium]